MNPTNFLRKNLQDSYLTEDEKLSKAIEVDEIMKGKKANIGEIRTWNNQKVQKQGDGSWKPVGVEGRRNESPVSKFKVGDEVSHSDFTEDQLPLLVTEIEDGENTKRVTVTSKNGNSYDIYYDSETMRRQNRTGVGFDKLKKVEGKSGGEGELPGGDDSKEDYKSKWEFHSKKANEFASKPNAFAEYNFHRKKSEKYRRLAAGENEVYDGKGKSGEGELPGKGDFPSEIGEVKSLIGWKYFINKKYGEIPGGSKLTDAEIDKLQEVKKLEAKGFKSYK